MTLAGRMTAAGGRLSLGCHSQSLTKEEKMNRLTKIIDGSVVLIGSPSIIDLAEKLAKYENTGLTPDEIERLKRPKANKED